MKKLAPKPAKNRAEAAFTFGLRGLRRMLIVTGWVLQLASLGARRLADLAGRSAARIRVR